MLWNIIVIAMLFIFLIIIPAYMAYFAVHGKREGLEESWAVQTSRPDTMYLKDWFRIKYTIKSYDDYELHAECFPAKNKSKKYIILTHGFTYTRYGGLKYLSIFLENDYNCIIYDNRGHGENIKGITTFGIKESKDLISVINDTYERYGKDIILGLHGESLGSGIQITSLKYSPNIKFIINDCGYGSLIEILKNQLRKNYKLPGWIAYISSLFCRIFYGFSFTSVKPIKFLDNCNIPICFIHGKNDHLISIDQSRRMFEINESVCEFYVFEAGHAKSFDSDPERYKKILKEFIENTNKKGLS